MGPGLNSAPNAMRSVKFRGRMRFINLVYPYPSYWNTPMVLPLDILPYTVYARSGQGHNVQSIKY